MSGKLADMIDPESGKIRVLSERCPTCIFRRGDPMSLGEARIAHIISENVRRGTLLTCHATLPYGENPDFGESACAGFWAQHSNVENGWVAKILGIVRIAPPAKRPGP